MFRVGIKKMKKLKRIYDKKYNKLHRNYAWEHSKYKERYIQNWLQFFPKHPVCEICKKKLIYFSGNRANMVTFDHKRKVLTNMTPYTWLLRHTPFKKKNITIWKKMSFGILCNICNVRVPTKSRIRWLKNALQYAKKK